jgi:hypothetical protein
MKQSVYLESSVVSYFANEINSDLKVAAEQRITREWWGKVLPKLESYISPFVIGEIESGNPLSARIRFEAIRGIKILPVTDAVHELAAVYIKKLALPKNDQVDAFHLAVVAVHELDFLVSWNCKHIANAFKFPLIRKINVSMGYRVPTICTPRELMEV